LISLHSRAKKVVKRKKTIYLWGMITCLVSRLSFTPSLPQLTQAAQIRGSQPHPPWEEKQLQPACELALTCLAQPFGCADRMHTDWDPSLEAEFPVRELNWNAGKRSEFQVRNPPMPIEMRPGGSFRVQPEEPALHAQAKSAPKVKRPKMKCDFCGQPMTRLEVSREESVMHCANCNTMRPLPEVLADSAEEPRPAVGQARGPAPSRLSKNRSPSPLQDHQDDPRLKGRSDLEAILAVHTARRQDPVATTPMRLRVRDQVES